MLANRFELQTLAGSGGMGRVYRARDQATERDVAVKVLPADGDAVRFVREAEVLASLDHPGVVRHVAHGVTPEGWQYLAMEWLEGEDVSGRLDRAGTLSVQETLLLATGVADALSAAHARGIVHRDLKPGNLFLVGKRLDALKLLDFGIARMLSGGELTVSGAVIGTPQYMAPEQVRGAPVDARADVYGLGAVMFRCLVGRAPFGGAHQVAVLAKIVLEPPPRLRDVCPDAPPDMEALLERMLSKEPDQRPADALALREELAAVGVPRSGRPLQTRAAVTGSERRVASVVLCSRSSEDETTRPETMQSPAEDALVRTIRERGGVVDALARGAWVVTIPRTASPQEQALRAVRCAMALASTRPGSPVHVATGRVLVNAGQTMGEVIDRAAEALAQSASAAGAGVWIDAATAELVESRFLVEHRDAWSRVVEEVDAIAPVRMLLGKPTPCVGRDAQAAMLATMLQSVTAEGRACAAVVTAPAGLGKTHLVHEFLRTAVAAARDVEVLVARGDAARAASPLGVLGGVLRRAAGIAESDGEPVRAKKVAALVVRDFPPAPEALVARALVGELCGVRDASGDVGSALRAARADPSLMADAVRETWIAWLGARASRGPVLLLLEDAHWADAPSLALVEDAVLAHGERPILLLATARPGAVAWDRLRQGGLVEMTLAPLSVAVSEGLVRASLGPDASADLVRAVARRAAGHPFHLEELIRAAASGRGPEALPDSVLGMVQARFDALDARGRRALRAASVFGDTFWSGGVAALVGDMPHDGVVSLLGSLVDGEVVTRQRTSRWPGQVEYRFRHALLREGAYATLADADRVQAHRHAAQWLEEAGESDPAVLAEHYDMGGAPERAVVFFHAAAEESLHRNDLDRALAHAARARALGPIESIEARLRAVEAEVQYWRGDLALAAERASDAARALPSGTRAWFEAVSIAIGALGQLGRNAEVAARLEEVAAATPAAIARGAQVIALARGLTQLFWAHHGDGLPRVRARLDELVAVAGPQLEVHEAAWVHRVRGESAWLHAHDAGRCLAELATSCEGFERAHATRAACLTRLNAASLRGWAGAPEEGLELAARSRAEASKLGADFLLRYGRAVEGLLMAYASHPDADATMRDARVKLAGSPRLSFLCDVVTGWLALERGDLDEAQARAEAARAAPVAAELRPAGVALASRVLTARGRAKDAASLVEDAAGLEARLIDLELTWGMAGVALAEARAEAGDAAGARDAVAPVLGRLGEVAATLASESDRARFWSRPLPNARASALAARIGAGRGTP